MGVSEGPADRPLVVPPQSFHLEPSSLENTRENFGTNAETAAARQKARDSRRLKWKLREASKRAEALYSPDEGKVTSAVTDSATGEVTFQSFSNRRLKCGRVRRSATVKLMYDRASDRAWFDGIILCRNMGCPTCSRVRLHAYGEVIRETVDRWQDAGADRVFLLTLTGQHGRTTDTAALWTAMADAWADAMTGREAQEFRAQVGLVDWCKRVEVTHSTRNGYHPHLHVLLIYREPPGWRRLLATARRFWSWWADGLKRRGFNSLLRVPAGKSPDVGKLLGIKITNADRAGDYLTKMGFGGKLALELTNTAAKESKTYEAGVAYASRSMHRVLLDYAETGRAVDGATWVRFCELQRGRRIIDWSRALRRTFRVPLKRRALRFGAEGPVWAPTIEDTRAIAECLAERVGVFRDWQPAYDSKGKWKGWSAQRVHSRDLLTTAELADQGETAAAVVKQWAAVEWDRELARYDERKLAELEAAEAFREPELPAEWAVRQAWALGKPGHSHLEGDHDRNTLLPRITPLRLPDVDPVPLSPDDSAAQLETAAIINAMQRWGMSLEEVIQFGTGKH